MRVNNKSKCLTASLWCRNFVPGRFTPYTNFNRLSVYVVLAFAGVCVVKDKPCLYVPRCWLTA